nr:hypothetical protein [Tanacetum cinerariifolium]
MLHIRPRVHGQSFAEPPFKEEILAFIRFLGHSVEHKNTKKSNEMYYPRFMKVIIHHFMSTDLSIPRRNKVNWHYVKDGHMFSTIKLPKASVRRTRSSSDTSITPPTAASSLRLTASAKGKQTAKASKAKSLSALFEEGTGSIPGVPDAPTDESKKELSWNSTDDEGGVDEQDDDEYDEEAMDEETFDPIPQTLKNSDDDGNGDEDLRLNIGGEEEHIKDEEEDELYRDVNINQVRGLQTTQEVEDSQVTLTLTPTSVAPLPISAPTITHSTIATITTTSQAQILPTTVSSNIIQNLPNFRSLFHFDDRLRSLEANFSEAMKTNQFAGAVSAIPRIVQQYMDQRMNEAVKVVVQIQSDRRCDEAQRDNDEFLKTVDENMQKIIKEQVKEKVKVQVSNILPMIGHAMNAQLKAEVLTQSSHSSRTSYAVAADLFEMELKKILIKKMEGNKSIQRSDEQRNLYKALVKAYESDKIILDTYGETVTLKRRRDDDVDKDEEPSAGPDRGSKRHREGKEPELASAPKETATRSTDRSTQGSRSGQVSVSESALVEEPMQTTSQMEEPSHPEFDTCAEDQLIVQSSQYPEWFSQQQKPPSLDRAWNKTVPAVHRSIQPWISELAK